jgi:rhamnosyltransferase
MISVIIRSRNEAFSLEKVLQKIVNQKLSLKYEIIVVDSDSTDSTREVTERFDCRIVNLKKNEFSWGKGLNIGIEYSHGEYCVLLSAHSYLVDDKVIARLIEPLVKNKNVAASYGGQLPLHKVNPFEEVELNLWFPKKDNGKNIGISDANACIRKEVWRNFKFDEVMSSSEDAEWAAKVQNAGYGLKYVPEAAIYHSHKIIVTSIYRKWYWRQRTEVHVLKTDKKVVLASMFWPSIMAFAISFPRYLIWSYKSLVHCLKMRYVLDIWKVPFYELVRMYGSYCGIRDGLKDVRCGRIMKDFSYYKSTVPRFLNVFSFIEN